MSVQLSSSSVDSASDQGGHVPVMLGPVLETLKLSHPDVVVDATFGGGGYTRGILEAFPQARVVAFDRDPDALPRAQVLSDHYGDRFELISSPFSQMVEGLQRLGFSGVKAVVFDVGVSSYQLDQAERGFSFRHDAALDMRMSKDGPTAADLIAKLDEKELADVLWHYGEERHSRAIARSLVAMREQTPILSTKQLVQVVEKHVRAKPHEIHPATRTFQALRIAVNQELSELAKGLNAAEQLLDPDGVLIVVSFHSLEDRLAKRFFQLRSKAPSVSRHQPAVTGFEPTFHVPGKQPVLPDEVEIAANPRARSAKMRFGLRTGIKSTSLTPHDLDVLGVPLWRQEGSGWLC